MSLQAGMVFLVNTILGILLKLQEETMMKSQAVEVGPHV